MQLAGQPGTESRRKDSDGAVFQNGKAKENRVSKKDINISKMLAVMKPSTASKRA